MGSSGTNTGNTDTSYTTKQEVVDYFQKAVDLFKTLDSYAVRNTHLMWRNELR